MDLYAFPWARASKLNQQICLSPAPGRSSILTHTGVEIDTCAFRTCCQLSSTALGMTLELRFKRLFQWREAYVLDNWQLAELPQSGGREFDPRRVHDNSSVPLWVYFICVSLGQSIKIKPTNMYVWMYVCMHACVYVCMYYILCIPATSKIYGTRLRRDKRQDMDG